MKYKKQQDGDLIRPVRKGYKLMCCDCGLVHKLDFFIVKYAGGKRTKIRFRAYREYRATAAARRKPRAFVKRTK